MTIFFYISQNDKGSVRTQFSCKRQRHSCIYSIFSGRIGGGRNHRMSFSWISSHDHRLSFKPGTLLLLYRGKEGIHIYVQDYSLFHMQNINLADSAKDVLNLQEIITFPFRLPLNLPLSPKRRGLLLRHFSSGMSSDAMSFIFGSG